MCFCYPLLLNLTTENTCTSTYPGAYTFEAKSHSIRPYSTLSDHKKMNSPVSQAAVLPFKILEDLAIPCGYERSFKLSEGNILANRYLLGINTADVTHQQLIDACHQLEMPAPLLEQFQAGLAGANLVFLGFEADSQGGALFKVYLEYWDALQKKLQHNPALSEPHLLHRGFKWKFNKPGKNLITEYQCLPGLSTVNIQQRIESQYPGTVAPKCLQAINHIINLAQRKVPEKKFIYVEVSEPGNSRRSFDLNLYPAGLTVQEIIKPLTDAAALLNLDMGQFDQLMSIVSGKLFGHISAGIGRNGDEYLTIYYEN